MRTVTYTLSNGTRVQSLAQAQASGLSYIISCEPIVEKTQFVKSLKANRKKAIIK